MKCRKIKFKLEEYCLNLWLLTNVMLAKAFKFCTLGTLWCIRITPPLACRPEKKSRHRPRKRRRNRTKNKS